MEEDIIRENALKNERKLLNYRWITFIIVIVLIFVVGAYFIKRITNGETLFEFISVTSAILSIVLSIFAILYSYNSMIESSRQWAEINKYVSNIKEINESIQRSNRQIVQTIFDIKGQVSSIAAHQSHNNVENALKIETLINGKVANNKSFGANQESE